MGRKRKKVAARPPQPPREGVSAAVAVKPAWFRQYGLLLELAGVAVLLALAAFFITSSWRKWPDPLIDFGRELYLPWRISEGAVLYRDVGGAFGPLSQYLNATLFSLLGPGLMVLVGANLVIFFAILSIFYVLCRRAWDAAAAVAAGAVFVSVFGFSQLVGIGNYNYATPYAHETTHGLLVSLALVLSLAMWIRNASLGWSVTSGVLLGLTAVLKPEFMLAGVLCSAAAFVMRWRLYGVPAVRNMAAGAFAAILPTALFVAYFAMRLPFEAAFRGAANAWLRVFTSEVSASSGIQGGFSGLSNPSENLGEHVAATFLAAAVIALIAAAAAFTKRAVSIWQVVAVGTLLPAAMIWLGLTISWRDAGRCLLGLMLLYTGWRLFVFVRGRPGDDERHSQATRLLLAVLATALMTRMALNGRIFHYGFYQAAIAGCLIPAIMVGELSEWLGLRMRERLVVIAASVALLVPGVVSIARESQTVFREKTTAVGEGRDLFYSFPRRVEATGEIVKVVSRTINKGAKPDDTLLVIPEGVMINYLARRVSPLTEISLIWTSPEVVRQLEQRPPDMVLLVSRDLREYGIPRYGEQAGTGQELISWMSAGYRQVTKLGGDPLDPEQRGATLFMRAPAP